MRRSAETCEYVLQSELSSTDACKSSRLLTKIYRALRSWHLKKQQHWKENPRRKERFPYVVYGNTGRKCGSDNSRPRMASTLFVHKSHSEVPERKTRRNDSSKSKISHCLVYISVLWKIAKFSDNYVKEGKDNALSLLHINPMCSIMPKLHLFDLLCTCCTTCCTTNRISGVWA